MAEVYFKSKYSTGVYFRIIDNLIYFKAPLPTINFIAAGWYHSLAINTNGKLWAWGLNDSGQLGINSTTSKRTPVNILGIKKTFCQITSGYYHSIGIDSNNYSWGWGYNGQGQLGNNSTESKRTPVSVFLPNRVVFTIIASGYHHTIGIDPLSFETWSWGLNDLGQLGDNSTVNQCTPILVDGNHTFCMASAGYKHSLAISDEGDNKQRLWAWGNNQYGQLGDNTTVSKSSPVLVMGERKSFIFIACGWDHSLGIDVHYECWSWGLNDAGQLGDNTTTCRSTPVIVLGGHHFYTISSGHYHSLAIDNQGQVWCWGFGVQGQIGNNNTIVCNKTPVSIHGTRKTFCAVAGGNLHSLGIDNHGNVWGWGSNAYGQLGVDLVTSTSTPILISFV